MWRLKQLIPKEQTGLEGRTIDIGNLKVIVRHAIAEGGFSFVYLARDAVHGTKQYALKHIICNDEESLQAVKTEILVMKSLKGHPNVVTLHAHAFFDMGRTKEAFLVMEYCDKSLVGLLESRGAGYFEEKQILVMFRDICNAVFAMHCQSPPIAHRDLKVENVLIGSDGLWKLCDFGSTSTNHKRFERPEEMGIEEDNIRKHTTPAYRAPEMWDLYRREVINEKVDIWALGCLLFRICYFKSAFDGESKLQILNGNYRIPELPKYSSSITDLIKDMLQSPPEVRPDITQVWFRVNDLLPDELQKSLPDRPPKMTNTGEIIRPRYDSEPSNHNAAKPGGPLGAFWSTEHAKESPVVGDTIRSRVDGESGSHTTARNDRMLPERQAPSHRRSQSKDESNQSKNVHGKSVSRSQDGYPKDVEVHFLEGSVHVSAERPKAPKSECTPTFQNDAFDTFVAEFDTNKTSNSKKSHTEMELESEVERLKEQLKQSNLEKARVTSKCEKLAAICRSQREEIQELKQALAARTPPNREVPKGKLSSAAQPAVTKQQAEKSGTVWELQEDLFSSPSPSPEPQQWQAFAERPPKKKETTTTAAARSSNSGGNNSWGFETDSFTATPTSSPPVMFKPINEANSFRNVGVSKKVDKKSTASQPSGWAGF